MMGLFEIISLILNLVLGGGLFITLVTLKSVKQEAAANAKKAEAEAAKADAATKASELDNVEGAIKVWRDLAQDMADRHVEMIKQVEELRKEVNRLRLINNKIMRLLDRITPENMNQMVEKIKNEIDAEEKLHIIATRGVDCRV